MQYLNFQVKMVTKKYQNIYVRYQTGKRKENCSNNTEHLRVQKD